MDEIVGDAVRQPRLSAVLDRRLRAGRDAARRHGAVQRHRGIRDATTARDSGCAWPWAPITRGSCAMLSEGVALVGMGMLIGVPGVYLAGGLLRAVLVGVSPSDPATLLAVAAGLALVALAACYLPARRALRIEPAEALRHD